MNTLNMTLFLIGIFMLIIGIAFSTRSLINVVFKTALLISSVYVILYALYLSNILLIVSK